MRISTKAVVVLACTAAAGFGGSSFVPACAAQAAQAQSAASRTMGTVKAVSATGFTLTTDAGAEIGVALADGARLLRTAPGQRTLAGATNIQLAEIQVGDRVLLKGSASGNGKFLASNVIVMKKADIAEKQARDVEDWQKRGIGGRITAIDPATGNVTVSAGSLGATHSITVHTSKNTIVRRYALDSVKFENASLATLDKVKVGDQLRARGNRSADGTELTAEEIVAGSFRNIAGKVISTDAGANSFTVMDLSTKKPVVVKISAESQMRKLPAMMAEILAKASKNGGQQGGTATPNGASQPNGAGPSGRHGNMEQMLRSLPPLTLAELQKGDVVMVVSTQGTDAQVTAITLLSGVEPILTASPKDGAMVLSPWSLGGGESGEGQAQ